MSERLDKGFYPFRLEALTPVHIGSGSVFTPLEYVIRQTDAHQFEAWLIDSAAWLAETAASPAVGAALEAGDMGELRKLLNGYGQLEILTQARIPIVSAKLGKTLFDKRNSLTNSAEISTFARNPFENAPYLPGSSLKGAISTALFDYFIENAKKDAQTPGAHLTFDKVIKDEFGSISESAMRFLKIGDVSLPPRATSIRQPVGVKPFSGAPMVKSACEALDPDYLAGAPAYGALRLAMQDGAPAIKPRKGMRISMEALSGICCAFYKKRFLREHEKFYGKGQLAQTGKELETVKKRLASLDESREILLRIGHYSHIECVTYTAAGKSGKTRTLADCALPFGWVILKLCSLEEYEKGIGAMNDAWTREKAKTAKIMEAAQDKRIEKIREAAIKAEEQKAREQMLIAMTPAQKAAWTLEQKDASENFAIETFNKLSEFGEGAFLVAHALRDYWIRCNKWEGKKLTPKQKEKIAVVKAILEKN